jgi:hypothetical protein
MDSDTATRGHPRSIIETEDEGVVPPCDRFPKGNPRSIRTSQESKRHPRQFFLLPEKEGLETETASEFADE